MITIGELLVCSTILVAIGVNILFDFANKKRVMREREAIESMVGENMASNKAVTSLLEQWIVVARESADAIDMLRIMRHAALNSVKEAPEARAVLLENMNKCKAKGIPYDDWFSAYISYLSDKGIKYDEEGYVGAKQRMRGNYMAGMTPIESANGEVLV